MRSCLIELGLSRRLLLRAAFVTFWLCKFIFGSHPHYAIKPLYFQLAIKISTGVSLSFTPMFLGHLYVQLDILQSDERQAGSYHIVTSSTHSTILQHLLWVRCARHLAKCKPICHTKEKYQSCPKVITDFCDHSVTNFPLAYRWVRLKPFRHPAMEFFDWGVGFSWRAYRDLGNGFTYVDSVIGLFMATAGTTTPLDYLWWKGNYIFDNHQCWVVALSSWWGHPLCSLFCP